jgi:Zn-dependent protease with chaperone function
VTIYALLILAAVLLGHVLGPWLAGQSWVRRYPGPAIALWLAALAGTVASVLGLVALAFFASPGPGHPIMEWARRCLSGHTHQGTSLAALLSLPLIVALAIAVRVAVRRFRVTIATRRRHREMLQLVTRDGNGLDDTRILDHPLPVAYCLPSRNRPIVVSSGALDLLDSRQLEAVLDHERAHLRGRHHLILALVDALAHTVPRAATFRHARTSLAALLEQAADDAAARRHGPEAVAGALRNLAVMACPSGALAAAATGSEALALRLDRLDHPADSSKGRRLAWAGAALSSLLPLAIITGWSAAIALAC